MLALSSVETDSRLSTFACMIVSALARSFVAKEGPPRLDALVRCRVSIRIPGLMQHQNVIDSLKYGYTRESNRFETVQMDEIAKSGSLQLHVFTILIKRTNSHTST